MVHLDSTKSLKTQQELLIEAGRYQGWRTYKQVEGENQISLRKEEYFFKNEILIQNQYHPLGYMYERDTEQKK